MYQKSDITSINSFISNADWVEIFEQINVKEMYDEFIFQIEEASICSKYSSIESIKKPAAVDIPKYEIFYKRQNLKFKNCSCLSKDVAL